MMYGGVVHAWSRPPVSAPWVVIGFSALMLGLIVVFLALEPAGQLAWLRNLGFVPSEVMVIWSGPDAGRSGLTLIALITALFIHANWLHMLGNLAYLWVFGIPVERALGHFWFLASFVLLGGLANLGMAWQMATVSNPVIGASGGVSAVIGIYLGLFPARRIGLWLPLGLYFQFARIPALLVIGSWFTLQLLYTVFGPMSSAVAWWSHVAGFAAGLLVALALRPFLRRRIRVLGED